MRDTKVQSHHDCSNSFLCEGKTDRNLYKSQPLLPEHTKTAGRHKEQVTIARNISFHRHQSLSRAAVLLRTVKIVLPKFLHWAKKAFYTDCKAPPYFWSSILVQEALPPVTDRKKCLSPKPAETNYQEAEKVKKYQQAGFSAYKKALQ